MLEILLPLTGTASDKASLPHALALAHALHARVHLVRVLENRRASDRPIDPIDWHVKKLEAEGVLAAAADRLRASGVEVEEALLEGDPTEHLVNYARRSPVDLLVLVSGVERGSAGVSGGELLFRSYVTSLVVRPGPAHVAEATPAAGESGEAAGGTAETLDLAAAANYHALRAALAPVTAAPAAIAPWQAAPAAVAAGGGGGGGTAETLGGGAVAVAAPPVTYAAGEPPLEASPTSQPTPSAEDSGTPLRYRRIVAALDGSKRAECVLSWVRELALANDASVTLAHVVVEPQLPRLTPASEEDSELARRLVERNREEAGAYLEDARARLGIDARIDLLQGRRVTVALHELVDRESADLVVLSAHGYGGESPWPFGDVATSFIDHGTTPLLLVQDMLKGGGDRADFTSERWGG